MLLNNSCKEQLETKGKVAKLPGIAWDTMQDTLSIPLEKCTKEITKREVLKQLMRWDEELPERQNRGGSNGSKAYKKGSL